MIDRIAVVSVAACIIALTFLLLFIAGVSAN